MTKPPFDVAFLKYKVQYDLENEKSGLHLCEFAALCTYVKSSPIYTYNQLQYLRDQ